MFGIGPMELVLILIIALLIFGPGRLPEIGAGVGKALREFRDMSQAVDREIRQVTDVAMSEPAKPEQKADATDGDQSTDSDRPPPADSGAGGGPSDDDGPPEVDAEAPSADDPVGESEPPGG